MSHRLKQINELLKMELGELILTDLEFNQGLITITRVDCSPDLKYSKIFISVLPENVSGSALEKLRKKSKAFSNSLKSRLNLKFIPKINWQFDEKIGYEVEIDKIIEQIHKEDEQLQKSKRRN